MNRPNFYHFLPARNPLQLLRSSHCQNFQTIIFCWSITGKKGKINIDIISRLSRKFVDTDNDKISRQDGSSFKLIKSKLPLKNAFKIGGGALKFKKFRLVMTILLSCISFGLFGLADTFAAYNHIR